MTRRDTHGGYLWASKHTRQTVPSPQAYVESAEEFVEGIIGRKHCVSLADDLDLYSVERNAPAS